MIVYYTATNVVTKITNMTTSSRVLQLDVDLRAFVS